MTTNFVDHKISTKVSREFRRVVTGKTEIVPMANGRERRNATWQFKKMAFTAIYNMMSDEAQSEVLSAFYACQAQLYLFRFRDYGDCQAKDSPLVIPADEVGFTSPVQLTKRYQFGPLYADRIIQAASTCTVKGAGGGVIAGTFDKRLGLFTPTAPWGSGDYTWSGAFDLWVRFNSDELDVTMNGVEIATSDIELVEQIATDSTVEGS